jgi:hypothetical protein
MSAKSKAGIVVVVPSNGRPVPIEWAMAIATLSYPVGMNHAWFVSKMTDEERAAGKHTRDTQREMLAEKAIALGADYMMCFDDDTVPPAHAIQSLWYVLTQNPKAAICGGIYCTKTELPMPIVYKKMGDGPYWDWTLGDVFPCEGLGTGCMMVRLSALKSIPKPWFQDSSTCEPGKIEDLDGTQVTVVSEEHTDDMFLCEKVLKAGFTILAHGGVLPTHVDGEGKPYYLPNDSLPVVRYLEKKAAFEAQGKDARNLAGKVVQ